MTLRSTLLGAIGTVAGSKYLLDLGVKRLPADRGRLQGFKWLRLTVARRKAQ